MTSLFYINVLWANVIKEISMSLFMFKCLFLKRHGNCRSVGSRELIRTAHHHLLGCSLCGMIRAVGNFKNGILYIRQ